MKSNYCLRDFQARGEIVRYAVKLLEHKTFTFARAHGLDYDICVSGEMKTSIAKIEQKTK